MKVKSKRSEFKLIISFLFQFDYDKRKKNQEKEIRRKNSI